MDARVLVFVFDLEAAFLGDADIDPELEFAFLGGERIAGRAHGGGAIARRGLRGVEVLVEDHVGWREDRTVRPLEARVVLLAFVPEQGIAMSRNDEDMVVGRVAMGLLVGARRHLRGMGMEHPVGEAELDVAAAGTSAGEVTELEGGDVGHEIGLPHLAAAGRGDELALAGEPAGVAGPFPFGEAGRRSEYEVLVVEHVHGHAEVVGRGDARGLGARSVEQLVARVERNGEQGVGAPLETVGLSIMGFDLGAAVALDDQHHFFIEMALWGARSTGGDVVEKDRDEIPAPFHVDKGPVDAHARPGLGFESMQIDAEFFVDGNPFAAAPLEIGVEHEAELVVGLAFDIDDLGVRCLGVHRMVTRPHWFLVP